MATQVDSISSRRVNLYEVLQVSPKAGPEVIQAAYRALARTYHPDVNAAPDAARQMRQLNAAYGVLSDPERRARYDAMRQRPARARRDIDAILENAETPPASRQRPAYIRPVPTAIAPAPPPSLRLSRVLGLLFFVVFMIALAVYALWLIAGALDDEPLHAMPVPADAPSISDAPSSGALLSVPPEIKSAVLSQSDAPRPAGR